MKKDIFLKLKRLYMTLELQDIGTIVLDEGKTKLILKKMLIVCQINRSNFIFVKTLLECK